MNDALRRSAKTRVEAQSYNVFCASCVVLAVQFAGARAVRANGARLDDVLRIALKRWTPSVFASPHRWFFRVLLKVSRACLHWSDLASPRETLPLTHELSLALLRAAVRSAADDDAGISAPPLMNETESLELIASLLSSQASVSPIPRSVLLQVAKTVKEAMHRARSVDVRSRCVQILRALAARTDASALGATVFDMALDLVLDPNAGIAATATDSVLPTLALSKLLLREPSRRPLHVATPDTSSFSASEFASVMALLSRRESDWHRVCSAIHARVSEQLDDSGACAKRPSNASLVLTTTRQAAVWCVQNRLRTHFGGPAQTFASIERLLMGFTSSATVDASARVLPTSGDRTEKPRQARLATSSAVSKAMVLEFVSALETAIANAVVASPSGDASDPDSEAHKTLLFYRANKKVCEDWLSRIRPLLLEIANALPRPELSRHHASAIVTAFARRLTRMLLALHPQALASGELLQDVQHVAKDLDSALYSLCRSYCETKDVDSIIGFEAWRDSLAATLASRTRALTRFDVDGASSWDLPLFPWLQAARLEAEMRYEDAAVAYESALSRLLACASLAPVDVEHVVSMLEAPIQHLRMSQEALIGCITQCAKCYAVSRNWAKLERFVTTFVNLVASLEAHGTSLDGCRRVLERCRTWQSDLTLVATLDTIESASPVSVEHHWRSLVGLSAMDSWSALTTPDQRTSERASLASTAADEVARIRTDLALLALQPASASPVAGECLSKDVEQVLLCLGSQASRHDAMALGLCTETLKRPSLTIPTTLDPVTHDSGAWSEMLVGANATETQSTVILPRQLVQVATLARQQRNFALTTQLLDDAAVLAVDHDRDALALERSQLLAALGLHDESTQVLQQLCLNATATSAAGGDAAPVEPLLRLADSCDQPQTTLEHVAFMASLLGPFDLRSRLLGDGAGLQLPDAALTPDQLQDVKGQVLAAATTRSPRSRQAWLQYSEWCYAKATQAMDRIAAQNGYLDLDPAEEASVVDQLDALGLARGDRDAVVRCFLHVMENGSLIAQRFATFRQQCLLRLPANADPAAVDALAALQRTCHVRALRFHKLAAEGYGRYLSAGGDVGDHACARAGEVKTVALRVLRLLTKFGAEPSVAEAIDDVFTHGPVAPWRQIVPQLLSRASHPVPAVASLIAKVLKRLARHAPHLVVYPAVVDAAMAQSSRANGDKAKKLDDVLTELNTVSSDLVRGVELVVTELQRISILWDEAWVATLHKLSADVSRRASTLEKEAARVERNLSLSVDDKTELARRKFVAIMKPILVSVDRLWAETCGRAGELSAVTPHERLFLHQYGTRITDAMQRLRDACNVDAAFDVRVGLPGPHFVWNPFVDVLKALQIATGRTESLPLHEISPAMASIPTQHFAINMPGAQSLAGESALEPVTVRDVRSTVLVLRTKTKPKCLEFVGSDGRGYKYLLKAREDLRLDERIMQFLQTANEFLSADSAAAARDLCAQHYSVIPLSRDSGLIQMVPDVTPMFQVFSNWNDHASSARAAPMASPPTTKTLGAASTSSVSHAQAQQSPTAAFYAKLKQYGVTDVSPHQRPHWPESVLRQVYLDLVAQRPRNIVQQEIALGSGDVQECWSKTARLSKSLAVMAALGYVIGLGDRHLDNILLCAKTGDVLHIDYNICFDKGLKLKVPEIVPFRLTPMLQDALGVTGVEGKFRVALETTLRVVRARDARESLLTLLEAFVYDPLVDWTGEATRRGVSEDLKTRLEVNVNLSLFLSRAEERRHDATSFERELENALSALSLRLDALPAHVAELFSDAAELTRLEDLEAHLAVDAATHEDKLAECEAMHAKALPDFEAASARLVDARAKLAGFASQCLSRHQQIATWKTKCAGFSTSQALASALSAAGRASFVSLSSRLIDAAAGMRVPLLPRDLLASLQAKSQVVDAGVAHVQYALEVVTASLHPWLASYSHARQDVDAFVLAATGARDNNVYWLWWKRCDDVLRQLESGAMESARAIVAASSLAPISLVASPAAVAESVETAQQLDALEHHLPSPTECATELTALEGAFLDQATELFAALTALKVSNAQGQRLLKLAGASWLVSRMNWCEAEVLDERVESTGLRPPVLTDNALFCSLLSDAKACGALIELVATPKGAMKPSRAADVLAGASQPLETNASESAVTTALRHFVVCLDRLQALYAAVHDNVIMTIGNAQCDRSAARDCVALLSLQLASGELSAQVVLDAAVSSDSQFTIRDESLAAMLEGVPAIRDVLQAVAVLMDRVRTLDGSLADSQSAIESQRRDASSWIHAVLAVCSMWSSTEQLEPHSLRATVADVLRAHATTFLRERMAPLLQRILSDVLTREWKFDFDALAPGTTERLEQWRLVAAQQMPEIFPSAATPSVDPQQSLRDMETTIAALLTTCSAFCVRAWEQAASERWTHSVGALQHFHRCRLAYAFWFTGHAPSGAFGGHLTQAQLLATLPAFAAELSRLASEQATLRSLVLELAQQLEYLASQVSADASFHSHVQACYADATALFDAVRDTADLLQGISIIETSTGESAPVQSGLSALEVDVIGRAMLLECVDAAQSHRTAQTQVLERAVGVERARETAGQKRAALEHAVAMREALELNVQRRCDAREDAIVATTNEIAERAQRVASLLKAFDKFKALPPARECTGDASESVSSEAPGTGPKPRRRQSRLGSKTQAADTDCADAAPSFSFMENERLVKILLRNIKSAEHLKALESVLDKHETNSATLHGVVASMDHALGQFAAALLALESDELSKSSASSFLAAAQRSSSVVLPIESLAASPTRSRAFGLVKALATLNNALVLAPPPSVEPATPTAAAADSRNLLAIASKLAHACFKLFFDATDMANRLSALEQSAASSASAADDDHDHDDGEEEAPNDDTDSFNVVVNDRDATSAGATTGSGDSDAEPSALDDSTRASRSGAQEMNRHGLHVLKRVDEKLSGLVSLKGEVRALTLHEQASWLIDEATKVDNLCVMYEGWTPWI